jgi:hypothetical protein
MSHHYSSPDFGFPRGDARPDFTDLYAFPKPGHASKSILVMNVHPSAVVNPPGPTTTEPFAPEGYTSSSLIRTAMPLLISPTECASRPLKAPGRPQRCGALWARRPRGWTIAGRLSSRVRRFRWGRRHE